MTKSVIVFNGPPSSGKDTCANYVESNYGATHLRFKTHIYKLVSLMYNIDLEWFIDIATDVDKKDVQIIKDGKTARQLLIHVSENIIKPAFGDNYFGITVGDTIATTDNTLFVISDSGFPDELISMMLGGKLVGADITLVRLYREGCSFEHDSRDYISDNIISTLGINCFDITNDGDVDAIENTIKHIVEQSIK